MEIVSHQWLELIRCLPPPSRPSARSFLEALRSEPDAADGSRMRRPVVRYFGAPRRVRRPSELGLDRSARDSKDGEG